MRAAFKFSKGGAARYIAHLDLMRAMNRAIRRAGLPAAYSQGFHPHIVMSFAQALGLGYLSEGEYMEIVLPDDHPLHDAATALNHALPDGLAVAGAWEVPPEAPPLMAQVSAALWKIKFTEPLGDANAARFLSLPEREAIETVKQGKNGPSVVDIRKGIYDIKCANDTIELFLAAGSALNIRPELVARAALGGTETVRSMTRMELYTSLNGRHTPLHRVFIDGDQCE